jgi:tRNA uridine 5-carboxymethylaminomethyl modification enzyme
MKHLAEQSVNPADINPKLSQLGTSPIKQKVKLISILSRPQVGIVDLLDYSDEMKSLNPVDVLDRELLEQVEITVKYSGYIERETKLANRLKNLDHIKLKDNLDYHQLKSLSFEAREKLSKIKPTNLGQASRVSGVSPADISVILVHLGR